MITISPVLEQHALARMSDPGRHFLIENSIFEEVRIAGGEVEGDRRPDPLAGLPDHGALLVYAEAYQGIDLLLKAFAEVLERRPDALLVLAGGTVEQVETYRSLAAELGVDARCRFTGSLSPGDALTVMKRATLLVSARALGTNTPMKIYHFLSLGKPFVATDIVSHTQVVDERTCFLAKPDPPSFARAVLEALDDPARARALAQAGLELYGRRYSKSAYKRKIEQMLQRIDPTRGKERPSCAG